MPRKFQYRFQAVLTACEQDRIEAKRYYADALASTEAAGERFQLVSNILNDWADRRKADSGGLNSYDRGVLSEIRSAAATAKRSHSDKAGVQRRAEEAMNNARAQEKAMLKHRQRLQDEFRRKRELRQTAELDEINSSMYFFRGRQ